MTMHRCMLWAAGLGAFTMIGAGEAWGDGPPTRDVGQGVGTAFASPGGARTYAYREGETFGVIATPGRITDVVLEAGERLVGTGPVAAGDTARWVIGDTISGAGGAERVHVMVKPILPGLATNLIINTDRRTYHLDLRAMSHGWMHQVAWRYPHPPPVVAPPPAPPVAVVAPSPDLARLNFAYRLKGPKAPWRPERVFDDGIRTYVEFAPAVVMSELPPLFVVGADGKSSELVNYRVAGQRIVVDRILDRAELRMGQGRGERRIRLVRETAR